MCCSMLVVLANVVFLCLKFVLLCFCFDFDWCTASFWDYFFEIGVRLVYHMCSLYTVYLYKEH